MKTEWWYDNSFFDYGNSKELFLARLTVRDDGTAQLLTEENVFEFPSETEASIWLCDEEYTLLENLVEELTENGIRVDPRIRPPTALSDKEVQREMVIRLKDEPVPGVNGTSQKKSEEVGLTNHGA